MSHFWTFLLVLGSVVLDTTAFLTPLCQVSRVLSCGSCSHTTFALPPYDTPPTCTDGHAEPAPDQQEDNDDEGDAS